MLSESDSELLLLESESEPELEASLCLGSSPSWPALFVSDGGGWGWWLLDTDAGTVVWTIAKLLREAAASAGVASGLLGSDPGACCGC